MELIIKYQVQILSVLGVALLLAFFWFLAKLLEGGRSNRFKKFASENGFELKKDVLAPKVLFEGTHFFAQLKGIQFSNILIKKKDNVRIMICDSVYNTSHSRHLRHTRTNFISVSEDYNYPDFAVQSVTRADSLNRQFYEKRGFEKVDFLPENYLLNTQDIEWCRANLMKEFRELFKLTDRLYLEVNNKRVIYFEDTKRLDLVRLAEFIGEVK